MPPWNMGRSSVATSIVLFLIFIVRASWADDIRTRLSSKSPYPVPNPQQLASASLAAPEASFLYLVGVFSTTTDPPAFALRHLRLSSVGSAQGGP